MHNLHGHEQRGTTALWACKCYNIIIRDLSREMMWVTFIIGKLNASVLFDAFELNPSEGDMN